MVPIRRPPFVHNLGLDLGDEILGLFVGDGQKFLLPIGQQWIVVTDEKQDVFIWLKWNFVPVWLFRRRLSAQLPKRVLRRLHVSQCPIFLLLGREFADGEVPTAVHRQGVRA